MPTRIPKVSKLSFDPLTHTYTVDDRELVSVTQCLPKPSFMKNNEEARVRGNYIHEMCRLFLLNDLNEDTLDPLLVPYLDALKKFLKESHGMGIKSYVIDLKSGAKTSTVELQIAAYIELVNNGIAKDFGKITEYPQRLFLETPMYHPLYGYAGTPDIVMGPFPVREGHALYLKNNGKYKLETIPNVRRNFEMFLQFLNTEKWCREHNLKGKD